MWLLGSLVSSCISPRESLIQNTIPHLEFSMLPKISLSAILTSKCRSGTQSFPNQSGQESFRSITRSYYRSAIISMLVYDITRRDTFDNLQQWLAEVKNYSHEKIEVILIGNKQDLKEQRQVTTEEAQVLASKNGFIFFQTSAKKGENIEKCFMRAAEKVVSRIASKDIDVTGESYANYGIKLGKKKRLPEGLGSSQNPSLNNTALQQSAPQHQSCGC